MPGSERAEIYFIIAMMVLILLICVVSIYFFFRTYKKEMSEKKARLEANETAIKAINEDKD